MALAIIGSGPAADRLARLVGAAHEVVRIASPSGASAELRMSALGSAAGAQAAVAATGDDERSLIAAAIARRLGVARAGAVVESAALAARDDLAAALGIDRVMQPEAELAAAIVAIVDGPVVSAIRALGRGRIRVWEAVIAPGWSGGGSSLRDVALPAGSRLALIRRGDRALVPTAATIVEEGDRVLLVANHAVADAAAARLGVSARHATRALVVGPHATAARAVHLARVLRDSGIEAEPGGNSDAARPNVVVLLDGAEPPPRAPGARVITVARDDDGPPGGDLSAASALARAVADLLPRPAVERVGTIAPGELDVYRAEAGDRGEWLGRPLRELPALRGWIVLAIQAVRNVHLPHPDDAIEPREVLIVAGPPDGQPILERGLRGG